MIVIPSGSDPIKFLVARKYPHVRDTQSPRLRLLPKPKTDYQVLRSLSEKYEEQLTLLSPEEIAAMVNAEREIEATEFSEIETRQWFNQTDCVAEWEFWTKAAYWSLEEAVVLTLGKDPRKVTWTRVDSEKRYSPFVKELEKRLELAKRADFMGHLFKSNKPVTFINWANSVGLSFEPELNIILERHTAGRTDWKAKFEAEAAAHAQTCLALEGLRAEQQKKQSKELLPKERDSLLKLVLGMAVAGYNFNPSALRNSAVKEIADDLRRLGIPLDEDTVRSYLQQGKAEYPDLQTEQKD